MKTIAIACAALLAMGCIGPEPTVDDPEGGDGAATITQELMPEAADAGGGEDAASAVEASAVEAVAPTPCDGPIFSPPGGAFKSTISVTISTGTPGATIYYTTDGSAPNRSSLVFTTSIPLTRTVVLRAMCVAVGYEDSGISEATFQIGETEEPVDPCGDGGGAC
jgi:Chitobiase/beta-hexosaminidase C-terminal domain